MIKIVLGLGSNCGDRVNNIEEAIAWLGTIMNINKVSGIYETPCAKKIGKSYMNAVLEGEFSRGNNDLDIVLKDYEKKAGRDLECRERGEVPIDIDIVISNGKILKNWDYRQKFFQIGFSEISNPNI